MYIRTTQLVTPYQFYKFWGIILLAYVFSIGVFGVSLVRDYEILTLHNYLYQIAASAMNRGRLKDGINTLS